MGYTLLAIVKFASSLDLQSVDYRKSSVKTIDRFIKLCYNSFEWYSGIYEYITL